MDDNKTGEIAVGFRYYLTAFLVLQLVETRFSSAIPQDLTNSHKDVGSRTEDGSYAKDALR